MTEWLCFECKNGKGESNGACVYIDPIGEMHEPPITCKLNNAVWVKKYCECCGQERP